ncbi:MAG: hypothetical protein E6G31_11360, partial [Actinobacteria bacterium]
MYKQLVRQKIAVDKRRPDGRGAEDVREVTCEVGVAQRTHGSALFTRGQTQIMSLLTLGTAKEGQRIDDLSLETDRRYMHHYNFPPYSVGETGFMRGPKRRDIGHGALAQRALEPMIPSLVDFPYTIRIVSETLESNGSSSMGSVCGSTLSLMDAGVPIKAPVGGIAMGLVKEGDDYVILTDIQGAEDHLGLLRDRLDRLDRVSRLRAVGRVDEDRAVLLDVDLHLVVALEPTDRLAAFADDHPDLLGIDLDRGDPRRVLCELGARLGDRLGHLAEDKLARALRLLERVPHDLLRDAGDLDVHLERGDAVARAGD